jgi:peptidase E
LIKLYRSQKGNIRLVDITKFEEDIRHLNMEEKGWTDIYSSQIQGRKQSYQILEKVFNYISNYIYNTGGSIFKIFKVMDSDGSNNLSKNELRIGLLNIGCG